MKKILVIILSLLTAPAAFAQVKDTFEVYFHFNDPSLTGEAKDYIDQMVFKDILIHGNKLIVLGFADYVGGKGHNDTLSRLRAKNVREYLMKMGFNKNDVTVCIGKGKIERSAVAGKDGNATDRKVQIIIDRTVRADTPKTERPVAEKPKEKIDLTKLKVNETIALKDINFVGGNAAILPESYPALESLYDFLKNHPAVNIRVEGHICCIGPVEGVDDGSLSLDRAMAVCKYLVEKGILGKRLKAIGLGNSNPVAKEEKTEEDRKLNRRVEIRIVSK